VSVAPRASAILFAYHNVGVRALKVLLDGGVDVRLVVTHRDNPNEQIWFDSVERTARDYGLACITPEDANADAVVAQCRAAAPDFVFSAYYRQMLKAPLLEVARRGAFNLHGSLLPKYRGRVPVNWAVLHGEHETGATLHVMDVKPDHGDIVEQSAVPILGDDTAHEVFQKVTVAAEIALARALPKLIAGTASFTAQDFSRGGYFGGRKPEDGRIPPGAAAQAIHNLVRAVAPPYPGAFFDAGGARWTINRSLVAQTAGSLTPRTAFGLGMRDNAVWLYAADGGVLRILDLTIDGAPCDAAGFAARHGDALIGADAS